MTGSRGHSRTAAAIPNGTSHFHPSFRCFQVIAMSPAHDAAGLTHISDSANSSNTPIVTQGCHGSDRRPRLR